MVLVPQSGSVSEVLDKAPNNKIALVYSTADTAGTLIFEKIKAIGVPDWAAVYEFGEDIVFANVKKVKESRIIFLSRHKSESQTKSLTVHMIGNFAEAKFGGRAGELSGVLAGIGANYLRALERKRIGSGLDKEGFVTSLEATHHGPFSRKGCIFIELGSSPADWKNEKAADVIARVVIEETLKENKDKIVIGLGGGHYCPDFTKLVLRKNFAFGHICPKHNLSHLSAQMLKQMVQRSNATEAVLDWKGLKENKELVLNLCKKINLPMHRVQNLLK